MRIGPYRVVSEIARGGMGVIYRVRAPGDDRERALKLLLDGPHANESLRRRFLREGEALRRLRHPHVVGVEDLGLHEGRPYLLLELLPGYSLQERLERQGPLPVAEALAIARKLAAALEHAHGRGVLHRDVKPDNVVFDAAGEPRLADFGLARDLDPQTSQTPITVAGRAMGTPTYWPPELAKGDLEAVGPRSDVYMLAGTLVAMLTGEPPHPPPASLMQALQNALRLPPAPSTRRPEIPAALDALCLRALAPDPAQRPASAEAFAADLAGIDAAARPRRGRPVGAAALALALGAAGFAVAGFAVAARSTGEPVTSSPTWEAAAQQLFDKQDYAGLLATCRERLREDPDDAQALRYRGAAQRRLLSFDRAEADLRRALTLRPDDTWVRSELAACLILTGRQPEALAVYDEALARAPGSVEVYAQRARLNLSLARWAAARDEAELALARPDADPDLRWVVLAARAMAGDRDALEPTDPDASSELDALLEREPTHLAGTLLRGARRFVACAPLLQGDASAASAQVQAALEDFQQALAQMARTADSAELLCRVASLQAPLDPAAALALVDEAIRLRPDPDFLLVRSMALAGLGRMDEAQLALDEASQGHATSTVVLTAQAALAERRGDAERALAAYGELVELGGAPGLGPGVLRYRRGLLLVRRRGWDEALPEFRSAIAEGLPQPLHEALGKLMAREAMHRGADLLEVHELMVQRFPDSCAAHWGRGLALSNLGRQREALAALERARALAPDAPSRRELELLITNLRILTGQ